MGLRIGIKSRRKRFSGICRSADIKWRPISVPISCPKWTAREYCLWFHGDGQADTTALVCLKPLHRAKYFVLYHSQ